LASQPLDDADQDGAIVSAQIRDDAARRRRPEPPPEDPSQGGFAAPANGEGLIHKGLGSRGAPKAPLDLACRAILPFFAKGLGFFNREERIRLVGERYGAKGKEKSYKIDTHTRPALAQL
jgi:hypothetical protein